MLKIQEFIYANSDWENQLAAAPYHLRIKHRDSLVMFNYTQGASTVSEIVNEARGLILDAANNFRVVRMGFKRFYNVGEPGAAGIDSETMYATEKVDGSLVMFYYYNDWHMSTRSTFEASEANAGESGLTFADLVARAMENQKISFDDLDKNLTYVFELVAPESQVICYYPKTELYFLMARDNTTLEEVEPEISFKWLKPERYEISSIADAQTYVSQFDGRKFEGLVVEDAAHNRLKVKNLNWLYLHKLHNNGRATDESALELIMSGEDNEFLAYFPQHRARLERVSRFYSTILLSANLADGYNYFLEYGSKKNFALWVKENFRGGSIPMMFKAFDGRAYQWVKDMNAAQFVKTFGTNGELIWAD